MSSIAIAPVSSSVYLYAKAQTLIRHSDLLECISILTLNTLVLSSKLFKSIPAVVGRSAGVVLSYVGVISLNNHGKFSSKSFMDLRESFHAKDWIGLTALAAKVSNHVVNILLICGNFVASIALLAGKNILAKALFRVMSPVGLFFTFVSIALDCFQHYDSQAAARRLDEIEAHVNSTDHKKILLRSLIAVSGPTEEGIQKNLKPMVIRQMDPYTWEALQEEVKKTNALIKVQQHFKALRESGIKQRAYTQANLGLTALGYLSMAICRANPDTLLQSAILWGMSSLYTTKIVYKKYTQSVIRSHMQAELCAADLSLASE